MILEIIWLVVVVVTRMEQCSFPFSGKAEILIIQKIIFKIIQYSVSKANNQYSKGKIGTKEPNKNIGTISLF